MQSVLWVVLQEIKSHGHQSCGEEAKCRFAQLQLQVSGDKAGARAALLQLGQQAPRNDRHCCEKRRVRSKLSNLCRLAPIEGQVQLPPILIGQQGP